MRALFIALIYVTVFSLSHAADSADISGGKDHPLISRYPGTHIVQYRISEFDQISLPTGKAYYGADNSSKHPKQALEGKVTTIEYQADTRAPFLQVYRNFQSSLKNSGFEIIFECETPETCGPEFSSDFLMSGDPFRVEKLQLSAMSNESVRHGYINGKKRQGGNDIYVSAMVAEEKNSNTPLYVILDVIEVKPMQDNLVSIDANYLSKLIEAEGKAILNGILFDTDTATLKAESKIALKAIADYLTKNKTANVFIVGHTDTVGSYKHNVDLSSRRAASVAAALVGEFKIDAKRLQAAGIGPVAPVGSNANEVGRSINRRVEMVLH